MRDREATVRVEALLVHEEWLRALARSLVQDDHQAEDIVQETWLRALQRPPHSVGGLRAWLLTVLRNLAADTRRGARRREGRERLAAREESLPNTAAIVQRLGLQRRVVGIVLELREPYLSAVLLRYYEELPPRAIAERLGIPVTTVKSRLKRGLAFLRARLEREYGDGEAGWRSALLPLIGAPAIAGLGGAGAGAGAGAVGWVALHSKGLAMAAATLFLLAGWGWLMLRGDAGAGDGVPGVAGLDLSGGFERGGGDEILVSRAEPGAEAQVVSRRAAPAREVRLVDATTGLPLPGARLSYLDLDTRLLRGDSSCSSLLDIESEVLTLGERLDADERGLVLLPGYLSRVSLKATHADLVGSQVLDLESANDPLELPLAPVEILRFQIVDALGRPCAGVPVVLRERGAPGEPVLWRGVSAGAAGIVEAWDYPSRLRRRPVFAEVVATLDLPLTTPREYRVDPHAPPGETICFQLPETGAVEVQVEDAYGREIPDGLCVRLHAVGGSEGEHSAEVRAGRAQFPHVALGLDLELWSASEDTVPVYLRVPGPVEAGERVAFQLCLGEAWPLLSGIALGADGQPLGSEVLSLRLEPHGDPAAVREVRVRTDTQGRFERSLSATVSAGVECTLVAARIRTTESSPGPERAEAFFAWPGRAARVEVGELHFVHPAFPIGGQVRDEEGRVIAGAAVRLDRPLTYVAGERHTLWSEVARTRTDAEGRFTFHRDRADPLMQISAFRPGYFQARTVEFRPSSSALELVLERGGGLRTVAILDPEIPAEDLHAVVRGAGGELLGESAVGALGRVSVDGLRPGRVRLGLQDRSGALVFDAREEICIEAGRLAELDPVDLRGLIGRLRLQMSDRRGRVLAGRAVHLLVLDGPQPGLVRARSDAQGRIALVVPAAAGDFLVGVHGWRPARIGPSPEPLRVALEPGLVVRLRLDGDRPVWPEVLRAALVPADSAAPGSAEALEWRWWRTAECDVDPQGELVLGVPCPGRYRVLWKLGSANGDVFHDLSRSQPFTIEVRAGEGLQPFDVPLDPRDLSRARAELERR